MSIKAARLDRIEKRLSKAMTFAMWTSAIAIELWVIALFFGLIGK